MFTVQCKSHAGWCWLVAQNLSVFFSWFHVFFGYNHLVLIIWALIKTLETSEQAVGCKLYFWPKSKPQQGVLKNEIYFLFTFVWSSSMIKQNQSHHVSIMTSSTCSVTWGLQALALARSGGTHWTGHQLITGLTQWNKQPFTLLFTPTDKLEQPLNLHNCGRRLEHPEGTHAANSTYNSPVNQTVLMWGDSLNHRTTVLPLVYTS